MSATTVEHAWTSDAARREAARRDDTTRQHATSWWANRSRTLQHASKLTGRHHNQIITALLTIPEHQWALTISRAAQATSWHQPDAAERFVQHLNGVGAVARHPGAGAAAAPVRTRDIER
jgi:hypothetical protein